MAYLSRFMCALMAMGISSSLYAGNTVEPAPFEPPAQEAPPVATPSATPPAAPVSEAPPAAVVPPVVAMPAAPVVVAEPPVVPSVAPAAAPRKYYMGVGVGPTRFSSISTHGFTNCGIDNHDVGYKLFAGRQLTGHFGIEAGYVDLGRMSATGCQAPVATPVPVVDKCGLCHWDDDRHDDRREKSDDHKAPGTRTVNQGMRVHGLALEAVVSAPVMTLPLKAFAKAGAFFWQSHSAGDLGDSKASGSSPVYGLGLEYSFTEASAVRLEAERYQHAGQTGFNGKPDINMTSVSYVRHF